MGIERWVSCILYRCHLLSSVHIVPEEKSSVGLTVTPSKAICHFLVPLLRFSVLSLIKVLKFYSCMCLSCLESEVLFESGIDGFPGSWQVLS